MLWFTSVGYDREEGSSIVSIPLLCRPVVYDLARSSWFVKDFSSPIMLLQLISFARLDTFQKQITTTSMRLFNSTASFSAALAASQAILHIKSTAAVASIVDLAYETESQKQSANESHQSNDECSFVSSFNLRKADADLGILSQCSAPAHVCVEDASSTLGGRCVPVMSRERKLQTTCETKCTPASACEGLSQDFIDNKIGQGSCCGEEACVGVSGKVFLEVMHLYVYLEWITEPLLVCPIILESSVIGEKSCIGNKNCFGMVDMTVGNNSCNGDSVKGYDGYYGYACAFAKGEVGSDSCFEYASCYQSQAERDDYSWNVGNNSCRGRDACKYSSKWAIALCYLFCMYTQSTHYCLVWSLTHFQCQ